MPVSLPPGAQPTNQLPNAQPLLTPVQQAGASVPSVRPAPPNPSPPSSPGGAGQPSPAPQPVSIAGQQVAMALPPGASPAYVNSLQRIETGNVQNPWTAGAKGTSAGGAYQFVKATWDANKPPGAPATAAAATPEQQTAALEKLTNTNAASLQTAGKTQAVHLRETARWSAPLLVGPTSVRSPAAWRSQTRPPSPQTVAMRGR